MANYDVEDKLSDIIQQCQDICDEEFDIGDEMCVDDCVSAILTGWDEYD
jgi:hypothetical protein